MKPFVFVVGLALAGCSAASGAESSPANSGPQSTGSDVAASAFGLPSGSASAKSAGALSIVAAHFGALRNVRARSLDPCTNDSFCYGRENKSTGYALEGLALDNSGIYGETMNPSKSRQAAAGVTGFDGSTDGGASNAGVSGDSANGYGVLGSSSANTGVAGYGYSAGVMGEGSAYSSQSAGVVGVNVGSGYAAEFINTSASAVSIVGGTGGLGVISEKSGGVAISALAENGSGVEATAAGGEYAIEAVGSAGAAYGVYSTASAGMAGSFLNDNSTYNTLYADNSASGGSPFEACGTGGCFQVNSSGQGSYSLPSRDSGPKLSAFAAESSRAQIEDVGYGHVTSGRGFVPFENALKRAIDVRAGYHVFLKADGDNRGLFVASKTSEGFTVREAQGGTLTLEFEYRLIGSPAGADTQRFPRAPETRLPRSLHR